MVHESQTPGQFYTEYIYAVKPLLPRGMNTPHSELDAAYKAALQASTILDWLGEGVTETFIIGDTRLLTRRYSVHASVN